MTVPRSPVSKALTEFFTARTGHPCGNGHLPVDPQTGEPVEAPLLVLDAMPGTFDGPAFGDRMSGARWEYSLRCVGMRTDQAEGLFDRALAAIGDRAADGSGWKHPVAIPGQYEYDREVNASAFPVGGGTAGIVTLVLRFSIATANLG